MAYDVAKLRMEVDSSGLVRGTQHMEKFAAAAKKTTEVNIDVTKAVKGLGKALGALGIGTSFTLAMNRAAAQAGQFGTAMAEVSTLIEGTPQQMEKLRSEAVRLSNAFGGTATRNTKAFYQAISAGAATVEDAAKIVEQANKLAVGGLTDVFIATDALTSVMNAYAEAGLTAAEASDSMFVAVRAGKTTIGELAVSLGRVAPFAAAAGVSFDELNAAIAAVTAKGINTNEAVTGIRQALVSIVDPSEQAKQLAADLGFEFGSAALEAQGLEKFMRSLAGATGGSVQQLTELLGSAEAANAVLALLAGNGEKFSDALEQQAQKLGVTDAAVAKMADTMENRLARAMTTLDNAGMGPGQLWLKLQVNIAEAAAGIVTDVQSMVAAVGAAFRGDWKAAWEAAGKDVDLATAGMNVATLGALENIKALVSQENRNAVKGFFADFWDGITGGGNSQVEAQRLAQDFNVIRDEYLRMMEGLRVDTNAVYAEWSAAAGAIGDAVTESVGPMADEAERAKIEFVQIGDIAGGQAWGGIKKAADAAGELADNLKAASTYADGTAPRSGNAGDGYTGVSGGSMIDSLGGRSGMSFSIYVPDERPLEDYFEFVSGGIKDIDRDLERFVRENSGALNDAILSGGADPVAFWQNFRTLAIDSYGSIIEDLFADSGVATNAIAKSLENVLNANIDQINANIEKFNDAVRNIDVSDAIRRSADGMSLSIDLNKFKDMEDNFFGTTKELLGSWLKGQLGGLDGSRTNANLTTKFEVTKDRTYTNLKGERVTRTQTYTQKEVEKLGAVGKVLGEIVGNVQDKITLFADVIGGNVSGMGKVIQKFSIDLGKDAKAGGKLSQLVLDEFDAYSDKLAKRALKSRDDLQRAGESWTDTLERLADDFLGVSSTLLFMGQNQLQRANLNNAGYASDLAALFGGVEAFNEAAMNFFNVAYSPDQQKASIEDYIANALGAVGINKTPTTRQEYQDLVEGFDLSKGGQREKYAALVDLAGLFDMILPAWETTADVTGDAADAVAAYNDAMSGVTGTLRGMVTDARSAAREFSLLSERLTDTAGNIRGLGRNDSQSLNALRSQFGGLYQRGRNGDAEALGEITSVATAYANAFAGQASSAAEYQFFTASLAAKLDELAGVASDQAAMSQYEEESLQALLDAAQNGALTNQLLQETIAAVGALDDSLLSGLRAIYEYDTGKTPGFADGGNHTGGYRIVGERGPELEATGPSRIHSNAQTRALLGIDELRKDMAKMHAENRSLNIKIEKHGRKMEQLFDRWDVVGIPPERVA